MAHELAHALAIKEGFGQEIEDFYTESKVQHPFAKKWRELGKEIKAKCAKLEYADGGGWELKRPEGYPTHVSYVGRGFLYFPSSPQTIGAEPFADTLSYLLFNCTYANDDPWFMKRVELVREELGRIKERP